MLNSSFAYFASFLIRSSFRLIRVVAIFIIAGEAIAEVTINGLDGEAQNNVRLVLALSKEKCTTSKWKVEDLFERSDQEIDQALRALGYYHATAAKSLTFDKNCWHADFNVKPGPRVAVARVNIVIRGAAKYDAEFGKLLESLPLKPGSPVHHGKYESIKSRLQSLALSRGYLNAGFAEKKLIIEKSSNTARIHLVFDSGKRAVFGDIFVHQDFLNDSFVQKYISIKPGDFYTSEDLAKTHNALSQSGYFDRIDIRSGHDEDNGNNGKGRVPVNIYLTPKKRSHYSIGLGFDTDIGPLLNVSYINRRINRRGHFFTSNLDLSPVLSTAEVEYFIPLADPLSDFLTFSGGLKREDTDSYKSLSAIVSTRWKHAYPSGWKQTAFLDYVYENFEAESDSGDTLMLVPGGNWMISVADNPVRPAKGYRLEIEAKGSYDIQPVSDVSFLQGNLSAIWLHKLPNGAAFIGRTVQGATLVEDITRLPTSYRFYAGGINSVRGYSYKELGPKDERGRVVGGKFLSVFSAEYEHPILENWGVSAFVDTGNAYNLSDISFKTGVGLGVRWYSPVGPIRLDFGLPLNESDSDFQIHFSAGPRI